MVHLFALVTTSVQLLLTTCMSKPGLQFVLVAQLLSLSQLLGC